MCPMSLTRPPQTARKSINRDVTKIDPCDVMDRLPATLQDALITGLPASGYYIPNFVSREEETHLLHKVTRI